MLAEGPIPGDSTSLVPQIPTFNGYSGIGSGAGDIVYVNYGLIADYAHLDSVGISVAGKVVIARYGRSYRGIKAREAERHGAAALLIYSDPADDGYVIGDVYPEGRMRPPQGVQRGSVMNGDGDPSTPGYPSVAGAPRLAPEQNGRSRTSPSSRSVMGTPSACCTTCAGRGWRLVSRGREHGAVRGPVPTGLGKAACRSAITSVPDRPGRG